MPCCFGGGVKEPEKPELFGGLPPVAEEPSGASKEADAEAAQGTDVAQMEEEAAKRGEEARLKAEEDAQEAEDQRKREEEAQRDQKLEDASAKRAVQARASAGVGADVLVRKELRSMGPQEQKRFCDALHKLMENKDNQPGTSEFFRIAGLRGWPGGMSQRGEETFPGWHRGLLVELERALVQADVELGNDGDIGLPYWDWLQVDMGEVVPKCIRDSFATLPYGLVDPEQAGDLGELGFAQLASDAEIRSYLAKGKIESMVVSCLSDACHWMHASKRCRRRGHSLEAVHDQVCLACGFPLSDPAYGGFHPLYFLLQCNLDRIYERYLQLESPQECQRDFQLRQAALHENRGEPNRFDRALDPFKHPFKKRSLLPADAFSTSELGYIYEELPQLPRRAAPEEEAYRDESGCEDNAVADVVMAEDNNVPNDFSDVDSVHEPVYAAFRGLTHSMLGDRSYALHVFLLHRDDAPGWTPPVPSFTPSGWEAPRAAHMGWEDFPEYAGCGAAMGGGSSSSSSGARQPFDVLVKVNDALKSLRISVHDAELQAVCVDQRGQRLQLEDTPLPPPAIVGPLFEDPIVELREGCRGGEVSALQRRLGLLGYDPGPADGHYGPKVREAVVRFQEFNRLNVDGVAGALTKARLAAQRKDLAPDLGAPAVPTRFVEGETVPYAVLSLPRHLDRQKAMVLEEIAHVFAQWGKATNLTFAPAEEGGLPPVLTLCFEDLSEQGALHHGGLARQGGQLSESAKDGITLDAGEHWLLRGQDPPARRPKAVRLYPVLLHGVGHCLGLPHSSEPESAMSPYYLHECSEPTLSDRDVLIARSMVKNTKPCGCDFKERPQSCAVQYRDFTRWCSLESDGYSGACGAARPLPCARAEAWKS